MDHTHVMRRSDEGLAGRLTLFLSAVVPPLAAAALTAILLTEVTERYDTGAYVRRLLAPEGELYVRAVPAATVYLFFWTVLSVLFHFLRIGRDQLLLRSARSHALEPALIYHAAAGGGLVGRLVGPLISSSGKIEPSHDVFRHQAEIEAGRAAGRYGLLRLFVWAMPILGFIGTVVGISIAVGNFSGFLSGEIEDLDTVKHELSKVSTGLSFAFDTTLLGLLGSLVGMMIVSAAQSREEHLHAGAEAFGLQLVTAIARDGKHVPDVDRGDAIVQLDETLALTASTSARTDEAAGKMPATLDRLQREVGSLREAIDRYAGTLKLDEAVAQITRLAEAHADSVRRLAPLPEILTQVQSLAAAHADGGQLLHSLEAMPASMNRFAASQEQLATEMKVIARVVSDLDRVAASQQQSADALRSLHTIPQHLTTLVALHQDVTKKLDVIASVPEGIERTIAAHQQTVARLDSFASVLGRLELALDRSNKVFGSLASPLEFRISAAPGPDGREGGRG